MIPVNENECLKQNTINQVKGIIKSDSNFSNINYGTITEEKFKQHCDSKWMSIL